MSEENEILKKLVIDEKDVIKEIEKLVEKSQRFFKIESPSGKIVFQDYGSLSDKQRIAVVLIGRYFASKLKIIEDPSLSISEIAKEIGRPMTALSKHTRELVDRGYIEYLPGKKYRIAYHRIKEIFDDVLESKKK